jgi:fatty acid desaturase
MQKAMELDVNAHKLVTRPSSFVRRIAVLILGVAIGATFALSASWVLWIIGTFVLGAMFAHAVELQHQCLHYTAFRSRRITRIVGICLGLPTLTSFHAYRRSHLEHHRNLGTPRDRPFFTYKFVDGPTFPNFLFDLMGIDHLKHSIIAILGNGDARVMSLPVSAEFGNAAERLDYGLMGFLFVCGVLASMLLGPYMILQLWLIPLLLVAQPLHFLIELPEHFGCATSSPDVFKNTRTIVGTSFSRWFTNYNNLHVEHHLEPSIPMENLSTVLATNQGKHEHFVESYPRFFRMVSQLSYSPHPPTTTHHSGRINS